MIGLSNAEAVRGKVLEIQSKMLDAQAFAFQAQEERATLIERVGELEKEVARLKAWDAEKQRYQLEEVSPGAVAYVLKPTMRGGEPMHLLCANCYQADKKRFLQAHRGDASFTYHKCPECGDEVRTKKSPSPPRQLTANTRAPTDRGW
jgi:hypothetical protein